jgi:hypothetical protein
MNRKFSADDFLFSNHEEEVFKGYVYLLTADVSSEPRSTKQRKERACRLLSEIYTRISPEMFVLCTLAAPYTAYATLAAKPDVLLSLNEWRNSASISSAFSHCARELCKQSSVKLNQCKWLQASNNALAETPVSQQHAGTVAGGRHSPFPGDSLITRVSRADRC